MVALASYSKHVETACAVFCKYESTGKYTLVCNETTIVIITVQEDSSFKCACVNTCVCMPACEFIVLWLMLYLYNNISTEFAGFSSNV